MKTLNLIICYFSIAIIAFLIAFVWQLSLPIGAQIAFMVVGIIDGVAIMLKAMIENER